MINLHFSQSNDIYQDKRIKNLTLTASIELQYFTTLERNRNKQRFALRASLQRHICLRKLRFAYKNTAALAFCASAPLAACEKSRLSGCVFRYLFPQLATDRFPPVIHCNSGYAEFSCDLSGFVTFDHQVVNLSLVERETGSKLFEIDFYP